MHIHSMIKYAVGMMIVFAAGQMPARAGVKTWNTTAGDWSEAANWTEAGVPAAGDDVVITNLGAFVYLTNSTARLSSLIISNVIVSCSNWDTTIYATNLTIKNSGILTCYGPFSNNVMSNRVSVNCTTLIIETNGSINVTDKGYAGGLGPGGDFYPDGNGPGGGGTTLNSLGAGGGGYGGVGVYSQVRDLQANTYGTAEAPLYPGSGGSVYGSKNNWGGHGGGAICITAVQMVVVNGGIVANSSAANGYVGAGGSGGGIYVTCRTITGTNGVITANGGNARINSSPVGGGGGGGGRIAVIYDHDAQSLVPVPSIRFAAASGVSAATALVPYLPGDIGTLYFPDAYFFSPTNLFTGQWMAPGVLPQVSVSELVVSNVWARLPAFNLTVTNTLTVAGTNCNLSKLEITDNTVISCGQILLSGASLTLGYAYETNMASPARYLSPTGASLNCSGDLTLTNSGRFYISAGLTNEGLESGYGAVVNAGHLRVATNCWVLPAAHPTNGAVPLFNLVKMTLDQGGGINADARGYAGGLRPGTVVGNVACGPGCATAYNAGSGYGGIGGTGNYNYVAVAGGPTYGSSNFPVEAGSGARAGSATAMNTWNGAFGGGSVQIRAADAVVVNGNITANALLGSANYGPGASGGAIYIKCRTFIGSSNGVLQANGGNSGYGGTFRGGGGGGGRIAVWRTFDKSLSVISNYVNGGSYYTVPTASTGSPGTIVWGWVVPPKGVIISFQ